MANFDMLALKFRQAGHLNELPCLASPQGSTCRAQGHMQWDNAQQRSAHTWGEIMGGAIDIVLRVMEQQSCFCCIMGPSG